MKPSSKVFNEFLKLDKKNTQLYLTAVFKDSQIGVSLVGVIGNT